MNYVMQSREYRFQPPNQTNPTPAKPGSVEKLRVMTERYRAGQPLHHPGDATFFYRRGNARTSLYMFQQNGVAILTRDVAKVVEKTR